MAWLLNRENIYRLIVGTRSEHSYKKVGLYYREMKIIFKLQAAEFAKRVDQIRMCVEFLEGLDPPVLKWSAPGTAF